MQVSKIQYGGISTFLPPLVFLGLWVLVHFSSKIKHEKLLKFIKILNYNKSSGIMFYAKLY